MMLQRAWECMYFRLLHWAIRLPLGRIAEPSVTSQPDFVGFILMNEHLDVFQNTVAGGKPDIVGRHLNEFRR